MSSHPVVTSANSSSTAISPTLRGYARRLMQEGLLNETQALHAVDAAREANESLVHYLTRTALVAPRAATLAAAWEFGLPCVDLDAFPVARLPPLSGLPETLLKRLRVLPLARHQHKLIVAIPSPSMLPSLDELQFATNLGVEAVLAPIDQLEQHLTKYFDTRGADALSLLEADLSIDELELEAAEDDNQEVLAEDDDTPVVRFVKQLLLDAIRRGASDIHFEPYESSYRVRFRVDGLLIEASHPPSSLRSRISTRLKVMARLDISERRLPQDGSIKLKLSATRSIDFRVNSLPTVYGEKIVLRLLDPANARLGIDALGFEQRQRALFEQALARPQGMILVTGPTGSGKTVTLYTGLNMLNTEARNIATAEDPVELKLEGINQVNVQPKIGLDFANALRAFLRQDPDVVMVGEVRDLETAEVAVKAAQTGHLVLSTLHTNSAAETLTRLRNMGVAPFNIATSVTLIIAQRLIRRLCEHCREVADIPPEALREEGLSEAEIDAAKLYRAVGCEHCTNGYKGRVGIYEVVPISPDMSRLIMREGSALELSAQAEQEGHVGLHRSGLQKVLRGITTLEELHRVTTD